ncbi:MAG: hypothetical protein JKX73_02655 [Flavobacteriales bacterium]|nr:hypothetical protein [Flavobacteriales bacterium]
MAKLSILALLLALTNLGCTKDKKVIVIPKACFTVNDLSIAIGDTLILYDCSVAKQVNISILPIGTLSGPYYEFDHNKLLHFTPVVAGTYEARLSARNNDGGPIQQAVDTIIVTP